MRARWAVALTAAMTAVVMSAGSGASATDPVELGATYVVDQVQALTGSEASAAEARLGDLYETTGADLYVVFVDEFTNPADSQQWADTVAQLGGLGPSQYLLAVATNSRQYYLSADSTGPMSERSLAAVESAIKPSLTAGDYAQAIDIAADGFETELADSGSAPGAAAGGFPVGIVILLVVAAAIGVVIWLVIRNRRKKRGGVTGGDAPAAEQIPTAELERRAASALVDTDDAVKTSAQELAFAVAQFGEAATAEFETALADAQRNLTEAFTLKQELDDARPDSPQDTRDWNARIIALCEQAGVWLDDKAEAFDELRKLEQDAPEALARVIEERARAAASLDGAARGLKALQSAYAPEALSTVADNPDQALERITFADEQLAAAQAAIGAGDGGQAAVGIRAAEEAVAQAVLLQDAIGKLAADLDAGERSAAALIAELEQDVAAAAALPDPDGRVAAAIAATRQQIDAARANLAGSAKRPLVALQSLEAANQQIDGVIKGVRDAEAQAQRDRQMVGQVIMQAQAQVSAAEDYITARRGAVGAEARTRLAEAGASLVRAQQLQQSDPQQAMQQAQRADQLAGAAIRLAGDDVGAFPGGGSGGMFGPTGGGQSGGGGGMLGAVLGGIVINSMLGGGGGSSGGLGGMLGGGSSAGAGRRSPGSFGGGGTRGRRGGGRF